MVNNTFIMTNLKTFPVVYQGLPKVISSLKRSEISKSSEVYQLFKACASLPNAILDPQTFEPRPRPLSVIKPKMPFIVMEGLDGSGKTKVSTALSQSLNLDRLATPPESIKFLKEFFDDQRESLRRAYYSLGNYVAAQQIPTSKGIKGVMMDRYWHSTACYAVAQRETMAYRDTAAQLPDHWYEWPQDLLKPQLVLFLVVSEKVRQYRHRYRNTTNTPEEQELANNARFRQVLLESYRMVEGVNFLEIDADVEVEDIVKNVQKILLDKFPMLAKEDNKETIMVQSSAS